MISFDAVATEVFRILRSYDYKVKMFDDDGKQVYDPDAARRFYASPENIWVSLVEDGENNALNLNLGPSVDLADIAGLSDTLKTTAVKFNMIYHCHETGKEIKPSDFSSEIAVSEAYGEQYMSDYLLEGMYGTTKSSYLKMENAKMIVRHSKRVDEEKSGSRSRHIEQIFVEDAQGQRFLFPTRGLAPARAMTQHVNQGGNFADAVGAQIGRMAQDYAALGSASSFIGNNAAEMVAEAVSVRESCRTRMAEMRKCFERLSRATGYVAECEKLSEQTAALNEGDDLQVVESVRSMLEGHDFDDSVITAVSEAVKRCKCMQEDFSDRKLRDASAAEPLKDALAALYHGELNMRRRPSLDGEPSFQSKDAERSYLLGAIAPLVINDELSSFLAKISDALGKGSVSDREQRIKLRAYAQLAIKAAGLGADDSIGKGIPAIREFNEWLEQFKPGVALAEGFYDDETGLPSDSQEFETAAEEVCNEFSVDDFLTDYADDLEDADKEIHKGMLRKFVTNYLNAKVREKGYEGDMKEYVGGEGILDAVEAKLTENGFMLDEGDLSPENVLIPTDQGDDLKREVTNPEANPSDINRMRTLAGLQTGG